MVKNMSFYILTYSFMNETRSLRDLRANSFLSLGTLTCKTWEPCEVVREFNEIMSRKSVEEWTVNVVGNQ